MKLLQPLQTWLQKRGQSLKDSFGWIAGCTAFCCYLTSLSFGWNACVALHQNIPLHGVVQHYSGSRSQVVLQQYTVQELIVYSVLLLLAGTAALVSIWLFPRRPAGKAKR